MTEPSVALAARWREPPRGSFTLFVPGISLGGHLGGLVGGALGVLALSRFGRGHAVYGRPGLLGVAGLIGVGLVSVLVSYWSVQEYVV